MGQEEEAEEGDTVESLEVEVDTTVEVGIGVIREISVVEIDNRIQKQTEEATIINHHMDLIHNTKEIDTRIIVTADIINLIGSSKS